MTLKSLMLHSTAAAGLLAALTIGDTRAITPEQWQWLARTGTTHVVSISGLHLALLAGTLTGLAGWLVRRRTWRGLPATTGPSADLRTMGWCPAGPL